MNKLKTLENWDKWKKSLGKAVDIGETIGMSDETINTIAERGGTFLANNVDAKNDEERLLKELWDAADENDRRVLSKLIVKITDN
ncbi:MAG: DUF3243 domain-containing protein [Firmicutes bacterium]|nr:DUF3243 domain-containing protein [Bacillota bacterium]